MVSSMRIPLKSKVNAGFALALVLLLAISAISYQKISTLASNNEWVIHTHEVLEKIQSVTSGLLTIQTEGRGYLLTGQSLYIERYRSGIKDVRASLDELQQLTKDNPRQQQRLAQLDSGFEAWLASWETDIANRNTEASAFSVRTERMNECRALIQQMTDEEKRLLSIRNEELRASSGTTLTLILVGAVFAIVVTAFAGFLINRELGRREEAEQAVSRLNEILERRAVDLQIANRELEGFHVLVDQVRDYAIIQLDTAGNVTSWNVGAQRIEGYSAEEILGKHFSQFFTPEDIASGKPERELREALASVSVEDEGWRVRKDGSRFFASVVITALRDPSGKLRGFSKVTRDITERKQADDSLRRQALELARMNSDLAATNRELEAFTYSVSHDLRAPLRQMHGFSRILVEEFGPQLPEEGQRYLNRVREGAVNMGRLIDDLLEFARIGRKELTLQPSGMAAVVKAVLDDLKNESDGRAVEWRIGDLPFVECDPQLMKQVFANLLSNALKYTRPRQPAVIEVSCSEKEGARVFFVRDNGVGFSMRHADKLFGVFQRLHRQEDFEGTGIGLATVQRIIHKHGGRVWVEAEIDKGATFYFTLEPTDALPQQTKGAVT